MTPFEYHQCIERWSDDLYRFARHCCDTVEQSDDVVQEAYTSLWEQLCEVGFDEARRFLFVVAQRRIADLYRRARRSIEMQDEIITVSELNNSPTEHYELHDAMQIALGQLPEQQRAILTLHDMEGYDYNEIAEMLQMKYTQVQVATFRARTKMKHILTKIGFN